MDEGGDRSYLLIENTLLMAMGGGRGDFRPGGGANLGGGEGVQDGPARIRAAVARFRLAERETLIPC
jgi:hypothetical protein